MKKFIFGTIISIFLTSCSFLNVQTEEPDYIPHLNNDEFVLRQTKKKSNIEIAPITIDKNNETNPDKTLNYNHFFIPNYIPNNFEIFVNRLTLYPNSNIIDISKKPIRVEDNQEGKFEIYKYNVDLSNVKVDTLFYSNAKTNYNNQTTIQIDNGLCELKDTDLKNIKQLIPQFNTNDSNLKLTKLNSNIFDESYLVKDSFQNIEYNYFIGLKKLDKPITYYNFENNKEKIQADNLGKFTSNFNYRYVIVVPSYSSNFDINSGTFIDENEITKIYESIVQQE